VYCSDQTLWSEEEIREEEEREAQWISILKNAINY